MFSIITNYQHPDSVAVAHWEVFEHAVQQHLVLSEFRAVVFVFELIFVTFMHLYLYYTIEFVRKILETFIHFSVLGYFEKNIKNSVHLGPYILCLCSSNRWIRGIMFTGAGTGRADPTAARLII